MTRLQEVAREFSTADEALRKALLRAEKAERIIKQLKKVMRPAQPKRIEVMGRNGREIWSLPIEEIK